jgi:hypothetical protein
LPTWRIWQTGKIPVDFGKKWSIIPNYQVNMANPERLCDMRHGGSCGQLNPIADKNVITGKTGLICKYRGELDVCSLKAAAVEKKARLASYELTTIHP